MNILPSTVLYSQNEELVRKVKGYLHSICRVRHVDAPHRMDIVLQQTGPTLAFVDLHAEVGRSLLIHTMKTQPDAVMIALGVPRSEPFMEAEALGVYTAIDIQCDRAQFQSQIRAALNHLDLINENQMLKEESQRLPAVPPKMKMDRPAGPSPLERFPLAFRRFDSLEALLITIVEGLSVSLKVSRAGIFARIRDFKTYRYCAGLKCMPETLDLEYDEYDPLAKWLEINAHMVSTATLEHIQPPRDRQFLRQTLQSLGAEVISPLMAQGRLIGWLFLGHRATGIPFDYSDLEDLTIVADHISTTIENAMLYEEVAVQKSLADTLFHSMPVAIVATDDKETVRWFNNPAHDLLDIEAGEVMGKPVDELGSVLADLLRKTLRTGPIEEPINWHDPRTKKYLAAETHCLMDKEERVGAVILIQDITQERRLREKQEQLERTVFWTELAASMSHEIRNPLVAIKTFAQLLPERFNDPEFRTEFSRLVTVEIDRLNSIIDQINNFAHPPELLFKPLDISRTVRKGLDLALARTKENNGIKIQAEIDKDIPMIRGDENALAECFAEVITNALEACSKKEDARITLRAKRSPHMAPHDGGGNGNGNGNVNGRGNGSAARQDADDGIMVLIQDNAKGIPEDIREKLFSPFCTTKARGMGLGLPIVKRTIVDHNGEIEIDSGQAGTSVSIVLPNEPGEEEK